jgi:hypothetical protein
MRCYFDGSQAKLAGGHSWLTLAGMMAGDGFWKQFENDWMTEVLQKHEPHAPHLHMSQLLTGNRPFSGWERERRYSLIMDAINYLQNLPKKALLRSGLQHRRDSPRRDSCRRVYRGGA